MTFQPHLHLGAACAILAFAAVAWTGCATPESMATASAPATPEPDAVEELFALMQGSFDSKAQAERDSAFYAISLHMHQVWPERGHFLYVEQALASMQEKPYRQRIYQLKAEGDEVASYVYKLPADSLWIGKWREPASFETLTLKELDLLEGCEVRLMRLDADHFKGATGDQTCPSSLYGASYAQSEVEVTEGRVVSWDRGFDAEGNHIWGAEKGGYEFVKSN